MAIGFNKWILPSLGGGGGGHSVEVTVAEVLVTDVRGGSDSVNIVLYC